MDKKIRPNHMLPTRDSLQLKGHTQTESEWIKKEIPSKWKPKESWGNYTYVRQ